MHVIHRRGWEIPEHCATPEQTFVNRRDLLAGAGAAAIALSPGIALAQRIADLPDPALHESAVLDHAVRTLAQGKTIKVDIPHRISRVYGRQLSLASPDGSYSSVAVFFHKQRLYQIEGTAPPGAANGTSNAIRFQQSLAFTDDSTNR